VSAFERFDEMEEGYKIAVKQLQQTSGVRSFKNSWGIKPMTPNMTSTSEGGFR
jgi:hypothetical protein